MSKRTLEELNLTKDQVQAILENKPATLERLYWNIEISLYYIPGRRRNALVYCVDIPDWRTSTRYNEELETQERFISLEQLQQLIA